VRLELAGETDEQGDGDDEKDGDEGEDDEAETEEDAKDAGARPARGGLGLSETVDDVARHRLAWKLS
jgi:hypothetical protein